MRGIHNRFERSLWFGPKVQVAAVGLCLNNNNNGDSASQAFVILSLTSMLLFHVLPCLPHNHARPALHFSELVYCALGLALLTFIFQLLLKMLLYLLLSPKYT